MYRKLSWIDNLIVICDRDELPLPNCDRACNEEVLTPGSVPNTSMENLDKIYDTIIKVYENRDKLNSL